MRLYTRKVFFSLMALFLFCLISPPEEAWSQVQLNYKYTTIETDPVDPDLLWLGTEGGVKSYRVAERQWRLYPEPGLVKCLLIDKRNKNIVWAGTEVGLYIYSRNEDKWQSAAKYFPKLKSDKKTYAAFTTGAITSIVQDPTSHKKIFLATEDGLARFDRETEKALFLTAEDGLLEDLINCVSLDSKLPGSLWLGSDSGLMSLEIKERKIKRHLSQDEVPGDGIKVLAVGSEWVLVNDPDGGIARYNKKDDYWESYISYDKLDLSRYEVLSLKYLPGTESAKLVVGTRNNGAIIIDEVTKAYSRLRQKGISVTAISEDGGRGKKIWFGMRVCSGGGVGYYSFADKTWWQTYPLVVLDSTYPVIWRETQKDQQGF